MSGDSGGRAVPYYCPFCASEDLWPAGETHGQWQCRSCTRTFALRFVGLGLPDDAPDAPIRPTSAPGGSR
ncbi:hypothetical protein [Cellulomonas composti]|uniref:Insertion element protein n=1 Tax=Cellulomonas composti TaxID=266130 RepID=A0A511J6X4_9CELL|nr:hypothetical protein [Cellulomonas composti]GEL93741.1 hypothetical protein CCO02nite_03990 [Cellulomonas composti]